MNDIDSTIENLLAALSAVSAGNLRVTLPAVDPAQKNLAALAAGIGGVIDAWRDAEKKARRTKRELESKLATIETQAAAIRELSTPILEIWNDVLLVPVVGVVNQRFGRELIETLLPAITRSQASHIIVDVTGVDTVEHDTASQLLNLVRAASLLGAHSVLTGVRPAVAEVLANVGADLGELRTLGSLRDGLRYCLSQRTDRR